MKSLKTLGAVALLSTSMLGAATSFATQVDKGAGVNQNPKEEQTPVQAKFKLPENGGTDATPENPDNSGSGDPDKNKPLHPVGPFGIDYIPNAFQTENYQDGVALQEKGQQTVKFTNTDARVGVKDKTRTPGGWTLSATLSWDNGKEVPGATIEFTPGDIKINESTPEKQSYKNTEDVTKGGKTTINGEASPIMIAKTLEDGKFYDAVYDAPLENPTLNIPDASAVQAGDYTGKVTWKLTAAEA